MAEIKGKYGDDALIGGKGNDIMNGKAGDDLLDGGAGNDIINGGSGADEIWGGLGSDVVKGGDGADTIKGDEPANYEAQNENLVKNGSFEANVMSGNWAAVDELDGWEIIGGTAEVWKSGNVISRHTASDGEQHLELDGVSNKVEGIYQDVVTQTGQVYNLSMDLAARAGTKSDTNTVEIYWNNQLVDSVDPTTVDFKTYSFEVVGTAGDDRLTIKEAAGDSNSLGGLLDNVSLTTVDSVELNHDKILGGEGSDNIDGMQGNDLLAGGAAGKEWELKDGEWVYNKSAISGGQGGGELDKSDDIIQGGTGDDVLLGGGGNDILDGGAGNDRINAGEGNDIADGGEGDDVINLEAGDDIGRGGAGNDTINAGSGNDIVSGGSGHDEIRGGEGADVLSGDAGKDKIFGGEGQDNISGGEGADKLFGGEGDDVVTGGAGNDYVEGGAGADKLSGNAGEDRVMGGAGDDVLSGGQGADKLVGGSGSDTLIGGAGDDNMWGGNWSADGNSDTFVISSGGGKDMVHDFEANNDQIDLSSYGLTYEDIASVTTDMGWATEIALSELDGGVSGDKLLLVKVHADDLSEENFIV